ncbi:MAG: hypothetical protein HY721_23750 [Planctomycetes bacterium]|nr:hypothetical protein [Planctomycetota bacterium]
MRVRRVRRVRPVVWSLCFLVSWSGLAAGADPPSAWVKVGSAAVELEADDSMVIGGGIGPGKASGAEGKLRAVATVIEGSGGARAAIVACDVLMIQRDHLDPAARAIEAELGVPFDHILINATHTHHAPSTATIHGYERDETFCARVRDGIVAAVRAAAARLKDEKASRAEMLFWLGEESSVGQNSRLLLEDGTIFWVGPRDDEVRPTGPFDPELPVLAFRRASGGYESLIFNHSTHTIGVYEPRKRSPAFYGLAAQELEAETGGTVTFVAGAFGSTHNLRLGGKEMAHRIKTAVREALAQAQPRPAGPIRGLKREITFRVREINEAREDEAVTRYSTKRLKGSSDYTVQVFRKMRAELAKHQGEERKTWVQALRIGDVAWVGVPGEYFTKLGVLIKRRSPFRHTYVAGVANDYIGYVPDERAYELGGYQVWTGFHSFVEKGTGERIADVAVELLKKLEEEK